MSVRAILGRKCTLAASRAAPCRVMLSMRRRNTDGQTDATVTLCFTLDVASVTCAVYYVSLLTFIISILTLITLLLTTVQFGFVCSSM